MGEEVEFTITESELPEVEDVLPSENVDPELVAEGTVLPQEVLDGKWGSSRTAQIRKLYKAGHNARAVMAEVDRLSS